LGGDALKSNDGSTLQNILAEGKKEFLEKGFKDASLRSIVKQVGMTTGAFYGYFPDKAALFKALVSPAAEELRELYLDAMNSFDAMTEEQKAAEMHAYSQKSLDRILDYIYDHLDAFKLIVCSSDGTEYEDYIDSLVEIEVESTFRFIETLRELGYRVRDIRPDLVHIVASSYFTGIFEPVVHDMPKDEAARYIASLMDFYGAGWDKLLGI